MATLKDIAQITGVSIKTVSRAINGEENVRADLRELILQTARELNYAPNQAAKSLRSRKSYEITGLCWMLDELYVRKFTAFEAAMRAHNYKVNLISLENQDASEQKSILSQIIRQRPAGVLLLPGRFYSDMEAAEKLSNAGIPLVRLDSQDQNATGVRIGREQGVYEAVKYLCQSCGEGVAYLGISSMQNDWTRLNGYRKAINENKLDKIEFYYSDAGGQCEAGKKAAREVADSGVKAVQTHSDIVAMGLLQGLHELKISVPEDIKVIGFDNREFCAYSTPPLTTIAQPNTEAGQAAAKMLLDKIDNPQEARNSSIIIPAKLIKRCSA